MDLKMNKTQIYNNPVVLLQYPILCLPDASLFFYHNLMLSAPSKTWIVSSVCYRNLFLLFEVEHSPDRKKASIPYKKIFGNDLNLPEVNCVKIDPHLFYVIIYRFFATYLLKTMYNKGRSQMVQDLLLYIIQVLKHGDYDVTLEAVQYIENLTLQSRVLLYQMYLIYHKKIHKKYLYNLPFW